MAPLAFRQSKMTEVAEFDFPESMVRVSAEPSGFVVLEAGRGRGSYRARFSPASVEIWALGVNERIASANDSTSWLKVVGKSPELAGWTAHTVLFHDSGRGPNSRVRMYLIDPQTAYTMRLDLSRERASSLVTALQRAGTMSREMAYQQGKKPS
jgi:hypothetical protein